MARETGSLACSRPWNSTRDCFGVGVDEGTALIVEGQRLEAIGESTVTICPLFWRIAPS